MELLRYRFTKSSKPYNIGDYIISKGNLSGNYFNNMFNAYEGVVDYLKLSTDPHNLTTPPHNNAILNSGIIIKCVSGYYQSYFSTSSTIRNGGPIILLYLTSGTQTYTTVIHELAHYNHYKQSPNFYYSEGIILESYATGIQYYILNHKYKNPEYSRYNTTIYRRRYTGIFQNLIDTNTNRIQSSDNYFDHVNYHPTEYDFTGFTYLEYSDKVKNYNPADIERAFFMSRTWEQLCSNILLINNPTRCNVKNAFNYWISSTSFYEDLNSCQVTQPDRKSVV